FPLCVGVAGLVWAFADVLSLFCRGASGKPLGKEKPEMCLGLSLLKATPVNFSIFIFLKRGHKQHCANLSKVEISTSYIYLLSLFICEE
uniref:Uncharacterized protein n=1 Tax=Otus sunia TaxID=257818 RepID=A0A8C8A8X8_9STRI